MHKYLVSCFCFLIQVLTTLGHLLEPLADVMEPFSHWYHLTQRRPTDKVSGDILLIVGVIPHYVYQAVQWSEDGSNLLDPAIQKSLLAEYCLNVHLREVQSLRLAQDQDHTALLSKVEFHVRCAKEEAICEQPEHGIVVLCMLYKFMLVFRMGKIRAVSQVQPTDVKVKLEYGSKVVTFSLDEKVSRRNGFEGSYLYSC